MKLFVGCSCRDKIPSKYFEDCNNFLDKLFMSDNDLIFGACRNGLMGLVYDSALKYDRDVLAVCAKNYIDDLKVLDCDNLVVDSIRERTDILVDDSDAIIFLPGGISTMYEIFNSIDCKRNKEINKPIIFYNSCGYYDKFFEFMEKLYDEEFASRDDSGCYYFCKDAEDALNYINNYYKNK